MTPSRFDGAPDKMTARVHGFAPVANPDSRVLILGTLPGKASLRAHQYYAHPQNLFWKISAQVLGFEATSAYAARLTSLKTHGVALWDVLQSGTRASSLDSDIDVSTIRPNDFANFLAIHPGIERICFNGAKAEALYSRYVLPQLPDAPAIECLRLPSTSPANAAIPWTEKLHAWRAIKHGA